MRKDIPNGIWFKCSGCGEIIYNGELNRNLRICPRCGNYFPLDPVGRIAMIADSGTFARYSPSDLNYDQAIVTGEIGLLGHRIAIAAIDPEFIRMSSNPAATSLFVCENFIMAVSRSVDRHLPLLACINSLGPQALSMVFPSAQTLSISAAISRLDKEKNLYISMLSQSNSQGNYPGFVYLADIVIMESNKPGEAIRNTSAKVELWKSSIKFAQTFSKLVNQTLFQKGMVDTIVSRRESKQALADILNFFC